MSFTLAEPSRIFSFYKVMENYKKCGNCKKEFPKTLEYFFNKTYKQKNSKGIVKNYNSLRSTCKKCHSIIQTKKNRDKRCKELNCTIDEYKEKWIEQMSFSKLKYKYLKDVRATRKHSIIKKIDNGYIFTTIEQYDKDCRINKSIARRKYHYQSNEVLTQKEKNDKRKTILLDSVVCNMLGYKKGELPKEIIETKRLIFKINQEIKTK